jgi:hypothetical protein
MFMLKNVRLSFPSLYKPSVYKQGDTPKFSATFLIPKGSEQEKALRAEILRVATEAYGARAKDILIKQDATQRKLIKDGDTGDGMTQKGEPKTGYAGHVAIKASRKTHPKVVGRGRQILTEMDGIPYAGCYVNAQIDFWAQKNEPFINCSLLAVQFWADGEAFGPSSQADIEAFDEAPELESTNAGADNPW